MLFSFKVHLYHASLYRSRHRLNLYSFWIKVITIGILFLTVACSTLTSARPRQTLDMHKVDWNKIINNDPRLIHDRDPYRESLQDYFGPSIEITVAGSEFRESAYVSIHGAKFADLSGDGQEEAVFPLICGMCNYAEYGALIYGVKNGEPSLIGTLISRNFPRNDAFTEIDGGFLILDDPIYAGFESICCPSVRGRSYYRVVQNRIIGVRFTWTADPELREHTVDAYYWAIASGNYQEAYQDYLSDKFQTANSYFEWLTQYQQMTSLDYKTTKISDGSIGVDLSQTEVTPLGKVTKHWFAKWALVATPEGWRLDSVRLEELP